MRLFLLLALIGTASAAVHGKKKCEDITVFYDKDNMSVVPRIVYFDTIPQMAMIACVGDTNDVVEMISNDKSLGVGTERHRAICYNGLWYTKNKYGSVVFMDDVSCLVHE
uniref:Candidate secreted effector protein n=1 Tax=Caenorhabditis tropicalis TaxID=1561998 RepID=A0A1I7TRF0_9PELO